MGSNPPAAKLLLWHGELLLGEDWAVWQGEVGDSRPHAHFAAQAVLDAAAGQVLDAGGRAQPAGCVLIEPLQRHRLMPGTQGSLVFLEPRTRPNSLPPQWHQALMDGLSSVPAELKLPGGFWARWPALVHSSEHAAWELAVRAAIDADLPGGVVGLAGLARRFGLSGERFRHLFSERMGLPLRRFVLWRRLHLAVTRLQAGAGVTEAAHDAGFADAAHFGRTLKQNFGVSARQVLR
jgi:AraC-like DNA-binding protein